METPQTPEQTDQNPQQSTPSSSNPITSTTTPKKSPKHKKEKKTDDSEFFVYDEQNPFKGIINRLTELCSGNPHLKGVIYISASSTQANHPGQVIDYSWNSHWVSNNEPDQWIKFDFKQLKLQITGYCIKTYNYVAGGNHLKNWSIQMSANDSDWVEIDHHSVDETLNGKSKIAYFNLRNPSTVRYLRLLQTGRTWCDSDMLSFTNIEFYGKMIPDPSLASL